MIRCFDKTEAFEKYMRALRAERFLETLPPERGDVSFDETRQLCFAAEDGGELTGLFVFNRYEDDKMLEKNKWLTRSETAARALFEYLREQYPSYQAEFTFSPGETALRSLLTEYGAEVFSEQQNMRRDDPLPPDVDTEGIVLLSDGYREQYFALHRESDAYLSGEDIAARPESYRALLALENGVLAGYLDVTHGCETNNVADLYVRAAERGKGHGTRLLAKALALNAPKPMTLQVDVDNAPALRVYQKLGFQKLEGRNFIDAIWRIGQLSAPDTKK